MSKENNTFNRLDLRSFVVLTIISLLYLLWMYLGIGYKSDQLFLIVLTWSLFYLHAATRRFLLAFAVFLVYWVIYDSMKFVPNYKVNPVDISGVYHLEKNIFGIHSHGNIVTPNEYFKQNGTTFLDVLTGFIYLNWVPIPLALGIYFFFKNKIALLEFSLTFLFVNLLGFIIYYIHPAAPPWYVELYGFDLHYDAAPGVGSLANFDKYFGIHLFQNLYQKNSNIFAAIPSLHSSYPVIVLFFAWKYKLHTFWKIFFGLFMIGIWFSAIYTRHHYTIDVIMGLSCAIVGIFIFEKKILETNFVQKKLSAYVRHI
jgi:inositol phosphorylceramide synthase catalytic subunit